MRYRNAVTDVAAQPPGRLRNAVATKWAGIVVNDSIGDESFGAMFGVSGVAHVDVTANCRTGRAAKVLRASGLGEAALLLRLSLDDLRRIEACGPKTVLDVIHALLLTIASSPFTSTGASLDRLQSLFEIQPTIDGETDRGCGQSADVINALQSFAAELNVRELDVLRHRIVLADRKLGELAKTHNVTSERVRQIELKLRGRLDVWRRSAGAWPALAALEHDIEGVVRLLITRDRLLEAMPLLTEPISRMSVSLVDLLPVILTNVHFTSDWVSLRPPAVLQDEVRQGLVPDATTQWADPEATRQALALNGVEWARWLASCELESLADGTIAPVNSTMAERATLVLRRTATPLTAEQLAECVGSVSPRNMRGCLQADDRIVRVAPQAFGLAEWGLETYEGIKEEIVQRVIRAGGRVRLDDVITELVDQFRVERASVRAYTYGREFTREGPWLMLRDGPALRPSRRGTTIPSPEETRRTFKRDGAWWHRVDIKTEMLRGSGFPVPRGVAALFGVAEGTERVMHSPMGPMRLSWTRNQPTMGSVRAILLSTGAEVGHALWIARGSEDNALVHLVAPRGSTARSAVAHLCGIDRSTDDDTLAPAVGKAIGRGAGFGWPDLASALRARGDQDVVKEIEKLIELDSPQPTNVEDFLRALKGKP